MCIWEGADTRSFSRAKVAKVSMDAISIAHFRAINADLRKSTRGIVQWHGHACAVKRVLESVAMPQNDGHFEMNEMVILLTCEHSC